MEINPLSLPPSTNGNGLSAEASVSSNRLHGGKPPHHELTKETPAHYAMALMFAAGAVTQKEVAEAFGVSLPTVSNLLRQQWFQERVTQLMQARGGRDVMELFKAEQYNSLLTIIEIRDNEKISPAVRKACAADILDRALGKPLQRVETTGPVTSTDPVGEVKRLEEQNARLRESLS